MGRTPKPAASGNSYNFEGFGAGNPNFSQSFYPGFDSQGFGAGGDGFSQSYYPGAGGFQGKFKQF